MNTMHPAVILGSYYWNSERLPRDEFGERIRAARVLMTERGWDALAVYGDCEEPGPLAWLGNLCPRSRWGLLLLGRTGEPVLYVPSGLRDLPFTAAMTWITEVCTTVTLEKTFPEWLRKVSDAPHPRIGLHGAARMSVRTRASLLRTLESQGEVDAADEALGALAFRKRPREMVLLRQSCALLDKAASIFDAAIRMGSGPAKAALEAERSARLAGAHDVRILLGRDNGRQFEPFVGMDVPSQDPAIAYFAVRYLGYWSEGVVSVGVGKSPARTAVAAAIKSLIDNAAFGRSWRDITSDASKRLAKFDPHPVFGRCSVRRIGLSLDEDALAGGDSAGSAETRIEEGGVYALRAGAVGPSGGAAASAMVRVGAATTVLWPVAAEG